MISDSFFVRIFLWYISIENKAGLVKIKADDKVIRMKKLKNYQKWKRGRGGTIVNTNYPTTKKIFTESNWKFTAVKYTPLGFEPRL